MAHELDLDQIELRRKAKGLTVAQLAKAASLPERTVRYALGGRPSSDGTVHALTRVLMDHSTENPLVRNLSAEEVLQQDIAGLAKMERQLERREMLAKAEPGETPGQRDLRLALAAHSEPVEQMLLRKDEELNRLATVIAKDSMSTREQVIDQLLAADPGLMAAYDLLEKQKLDAVVKAEAAAQAEARWQQEFGLAAGRSQLFGIEANREDLAKARTLPTPKPNHVPSPPAADITNLSTDDIGAQDAVAEGRAAMAWSQREGLLFDTMIELIKAFRKAGSPAAPDRVAPTRKAEGERIEPSPVSKAEFDHWREHIAAGDGSWTRRVPIVFAEAGKRPVKLPDTYEGIAMAHPDEKHGYIAHSASPGECAICGGDLGGERHWTDAGA